MRKLFSTLALWLLYVPLAHAQDLGAGNLAAVGNQAKLKNDTPLPLIIGNMVRTLIGMIGILFGLMVVYAGFLYLTAGGEEEKVKHAKETLSRGVIGLIIVMMAYIIAAFVVNAVTATMATSTGS